MLIRAIDLYILAHSTYMYISIPLKPLVTTANLQIIESPGDGRGPLY